MSTIARCGFIAAYCDHTDCELYREGENIVAYIPCKATWEATITLGTDSYVTAEIVAREMGLEPNWS